MKLVQHRHKAQCLAVPNVYICTESCKTCLHPYLTSYLHVLYTYTAFVGCFNLSREIRMHQIVQGYSRHLGQGIKEWTN